MKNTISNLACLCISKLYIQLYESNYDICKWDFVFITEKIENLTESIAVPYLHDLGGWPVLGNKAGGRWNSSTFKIEDLLVTVREYTNSAPIMDSYVYDDSKDPLTRILYVSQSSEEVLSIHIYFNSKLALFECL